MKKKLERLNFFYKAIYGENINMLTDFDYRIKLQKLIYILQSEGIPFDYDFTWYIYGPYSPQLARDGYAFMKEDISEYNYNPEPTEQNIVERIKKAQGIFDDADKAEIIASLHYLKQRCKAESQAQEELRTRKPRFSLEKIQQAAKDWNKLTNSIL
jgi:uncharacterized protein YwgA